jgi:hypothetical protein
MTILKPIFIDPRLRRFEYTAAQTSQSSSGLPSRTNLSTVATRTGLHEFESKETRRDVELIDLSCTPEEEDNLDVQAMSSDDNQTLSNSSPSAGRGKKKPTASSQLSRHNGVKVRLSDGVPMRRPPVHSWTRSEKLFLLVLIRRFKVDWIEAAQILAARFPNPVAPFASQMVRSYYADMKRKSDHGDAKNSINPPNSDEEKRIIDEIRRVTSKNKVKLQFKSPPTPTPLRSEGMSRRSCTHFLPNSMDVDDEETSGDILEPEDTMDIDEVGEPQSDTSIVDTPCNTPDSQEGVLN